jgi:hypothetical protein
VPTTPRENERILRIALEYLPAAKLRELLARLWSEVGAASANGSGRESLRALRQLTEGLPAEAPPPQAR